MADETAMAEEKTYEDPDFIGKDSLHSYLHFKTKSSTNPIKMFRIMQQRIIFGRDILI